MRGRGKTQKFSSPLIGEERVLELLEKASNGDEGALSELKHLMKDGKANRRIRAIVKRHNTAKFNGFSGSDSGSLSKISRWGYRK